MTHRLHVETDGERPQGEGTVSGLALALGWWVDPDHEGEPTGTLYLVADPALPRPVWVAQARLGRFSVD